MSDRHRVVRVAQSWLSNAISTSSAAQTICGVDCGGFHRSGHESRSSSRIIELPKYTRDWFLHCKQRDSTLYSDVLDAYLQRTEWPGIGDVVGMSYGVCKVAHAAIIVDQGNLVAASALERMVCLVERRHLLSI